MQRPLEYTRVFSDNAGESHTETAAITVQSERFAPPTPPLDVSAMSKAAGGGLNLRTTFTKIVARAGCKPWPRLFQNLRASCETDWVEKHPAHECAAWLGHSPAIAAAHYLQARNHHFEAVVNAGRKSDAESDAATAQNRAQQASATNRKTEWKPIDRPELSQVFRARPNECTNQ